VRRALFIHFTKASALTQAALEVATCQCTSRLPKSAIRMPENGRG
jgi:hypothetical protein